MSKPAVQVPRGVQVQKEGGPTGGSEAVLPPPSTKERENISTGEIEASQLPSSEQESTPTEGGHGTPANS